MSLMVSCELVSQLLSLSFVVDMWSSTEEFAVEKEGDAEEEVTARSEFTVGKEGGDEEEVMRRLQFAKGKGGADEEEVMRRILTTLLFSFCTVNVLFSYSVN